ncbi:MAG: hypothetical protein ABJF10_00710 [Chthoniobacter sp.]|uniref:hypothetical protein n=1 Tax=Chthoniobacter sp. TaxID=2510640 RepID=UPI0032A45CF6
MTSSEAVVTLLEAIEAAGVKYVIVGALAAGAWGIPRSTKDADFVVACAAPELDAVLRQLPPSISVDPQARMELFTGTLRWVLHVENTSFEIEVFLLGDDPHHAEIFRRKRREHIGMIDREAWVPTAEDLVIQKLRWARRKDLDDVQNILAVQGAGIDQVYLQTWCERHGTLDRLSELRRGIPPEL